MQPSLAVSLRGHYLLVALIARKRVPAEMLRSDVLRRGMLVVQRGVTPNVLLADMHVLSASDVCGVAHLRYHERTAVAPGTRSGVRQDGQLPANLAPDLMAAALRASMAVDNAWRRCLTGLQPDLAAAHAEIATAGAPRRLPHRAITASVRASTCARKAREGATEPPAPGRSSRGRC